MPVAKRQTLGCLQHSDSYRHLAIHSISLMSFRDFLTPDKTLPKIVPNYLLGSNRVPAVQQAVSPKSIIYLKAPVRFL